MTIGGMVDKVAGLKVADLPIGKALLVLSAIGVGKGVSDIVWQKWPAASKYAGIVAGGGLALAVKKIGPVRRFLGETGAETLAIGGISAAILSLYDVQGHVEEYISRIGGAIPTGLVAAKPAAPEKVVGSPETGSPEVYESDVARRLRAARQAQLARL